MAFTSYGVRSSPSPSAPPLIPGLVSTHHREANRTHFRRGQLLGRMAVGKPTSIEEPAPAAANARSVAFNDPREAPASAVRPTSTHVRDKEASKCVSSAFREDPTQPAWITHDRQVLRFFGYFVERSRDDGDRYLATSSSSERHSRDASETVRRVVVCFHLSDRSIAISEPRVANSGRVQGAFLKRTVLSKAPPNGQARPELFAPSDFRVGGELRVCDRVIHLVDCDEATRAFYRENGALEPVESPRKYPDDPLDAAADEVAAIQDRLRAREKAQSESVAERVRKFHELSGKVLRFSAVWKDSHPLYPETRRLALLYYLSNDTLEVLELQPRHSALSTAASADGSAHSRSRVLLSRRRIALERPGYQSEDSH